ncbi:MAG: Sua5/YciO/YrdC/YwlC family protein [Candidatus Omnitrophica bacterium]|nr:Sua5/YciO/YrdC/YwlC family protein [Candidatus Omnitrophota bacterium]MDD3987968.1 Sua5/YciO/YrdC/YwlC family protein [Candidatus Omnitrophota bacterium]MDD4982255.1 Sua5/YciO/YrdC/YwlC family protein [Candidatus Omnitrophota bacterium]
MIRETAEVIKLGGLVAFPTETVYGFGADPSILRYSEKLWQCYF